jgi:hypothetical protein
MRSQLPLLEVPWLKLQSNHKTGRRDSLEPRWDKKEFDLIKQSTLNQVLQQKGIQ